MSLSADAASARLVAEQLAEVLATGDSGGFADLLDPGAEWGDDPEWGCHNRAEVLAWFRRAFANGLRGEVLEVVPGRDALLSGVRLLARPGDVADEEVAEPALRWQVLRLAGGRIAGIHGYDSREEAARRAGLPAEG